MRLRSTGLSMKACLLCVPLSGVWAVSAAEGATIQYRQGQFPDGSYQHLGSELRLSSPDNNWGGSDLIRTGNSGGNFLRTVLAFDLTGIPGGAVITGVELRMHAESTQDTVKGVEVRRINHATHAMVEGAANDAADPFGVTWNRVQNDGGDIAWASAGGDFDAAPLSSVGDFSAASTQTFLSSPAFVAAAQDALANDGGLLELILYSPASEADFFAGFVRWSSDDASTLANRPLLTVSFEVPEPSTAMLLVGAGWMICGRRLRCG